MPEQDLEVGGNSSPRLEVGHFYGCGVPSGLTGGGYRSHCLFYRWSEAGACEE